MPKRKADLLVGLDIGTTKIVALIAQSSAEGELSILGAGVHPSTGLKRGVVVNIDATVQSIRRAIDEAELMAGCGVREVVVGIAGSHVKSLNSHGIVAIREQEVTPIDVEQVIEAAKAVAIPADQEILHVLPQVYMVDDQEGIQDPLGMSGVRLEATAHIVTGSVCAAQNIVKCVERCQLRVADIVLEQLASSCVLTDDEKSMGVCVVDIGGGTTDIALFSGGAVCHTGVIPIAGSQVTNDISVAMRMPYRHAEAIKLEHAQLQPLAEGESEDIRFHDSDKQERVVSKSMLIDVIHARYHELFTLVLSNLKQSGMMSRLVAGVVLTGGAAKVPGIAELAADIFKVPVRVGVPQGVAGKDDLLVNPIYATSVGLLLHAQQQQWHGAAGTPLLRGARSVMQRMSRWFEYNF